MKQRVHKPCQRCGNEMADWRECHAEELGITAKRNPDPKIREYFALKSMSISPVGRMPGKWDLDDSCW